MSIYININTSICFVLHMCIHDGTFVFFMFMVGDLNDGSSVLNDI